MLIMQFNRKIINKTKKIIMTQFTSIFTTYIDFRLVILIIISSYWVKKNFNEWLPKLSVVHKVFIWSTILTVAYYYVLKITGVFQVENFYNYLFSYFFATSFYELLCAPFEGFIKKWADKFFS